MDFTIGYAVGNVVPCCTECNLAKNSSFTYAEMLLLGRIIGEIKAKRQANSESHETRLGCPRKY